MHFYNLLCCPALSVHGAPHSACSTFDHTARIQHSKHQQTAKVTTTTTATPPHQQTAACSYVASKGQGCVVCCGSCMLPCSTKDGGVHANHAMPVVSARCRSRVKQQAQELLCLWGSCCAARRPRLADGTPPYHTHTTQALLQRADNDDAPSPPGFVSKDRALPQPTPLPPATTTGTTRHPSHTPYTQTHTNTHSLTACA